MLCHRRAQLELQLARAQALLNNDGLIRGLPDKGARVRAQVEDLQGQLQRLEIETTPAGDSGPVGQHSETSTASSSVSDSDEHAVAISAAAPPPGADRELAAVTTAESAETSAQAATHEDAGQPRLRVLRKELHAQASALEQLRAQGPNSEEAIKV